MSFCTNLLHQTKCSHFRVHSFFFVFIILHYINTDWPRDFAKLKKFQKSKKKTWIDLTPPTHPIQIFLETHHWHGQNTQIIITNSFYQCIYRQNTYGILLQNISTGLELFWDDLKKKNSEWYLDPPTHFHSNLGFLEFFSFAQPPIHYYRNKKCCILLDIPLLDSWYLKVCILYLQIE